MNNNHVYDMLVVGGGPGGYTAALYAARSGLDTVVLEKLSAGGQMALTEQIDNYPGFENGIDGFSLAEKMQKQAERFGARSEYAEVLRMDLTAVPKLVETSEGIFRGKTVVLATGADPRTLGVAGETELLGRGVAYCAACDGMFYKDKTVVVVGGGPGGYTAALYAARAGLDTIVLEKLSAGGQMALTEQIDNYPGFEDGIDGFSLAEKMQKQAERFGARSEYAEVLRMDLTAVPKLVETSEGIFLGKTVVLATGANPRTLGVARELELVGRGVAYCAACDGMFYKGKTVVVVGGGNSAAADALLLSRVAKKVILVHRRDTLRATKIYHEPLAQAENVEFRWNSVVSALLSGDRLTGVRLRDTVTGEESVVDCDGVFVSVGRQPATALAVGQLALDGGGYIVAGETTETSIPGVYAVGDVRTKPLRQVVTAVADGAVAVHMAEKYIAENR